MENQQNLNILDLTENIDLREYVNIILKRKWILVICFLIPVFLISIYTFSKRTVYRAEAVIEVISGYTMPMDEIYREKGGYEYVNNQKKILEGPTTKDRVFKKLSDRWKSTLPKKYLDPDVKVSVVSGTTMLKIWVDSPYKEYAKEFLTLLTQEFLSIKKEQKEGNSEFALVSLTKEANELSNKLNSAQKELQDFRQKNDDLVLEEYGDFSNRHIMKLANRLSEVQTEKALISKQISVLEKSEDPALWISVIDSLQKDTVTSAIQREKNPNPNGFSSEGTQEGNSQKAVESNATPLPFVFVLEKGQSQKWEDLKERYQTLRADLSRVQNIYKPDHPERKRMEQELKQVDTEMRAEIAALLETFRAKYKSLELEEDALKSNISQFKNSNFSSSDKMNELQRLKTNYERLNALYAVLIDRMGKIRINSDLTGQETITVIEKPRVLDKPVGPKRLRNLFIGIMFGLGFGVGMVFFLDYLDDTVESVEDLKDLSIPVIGIVHSIDWNQKDLKTHRINILNEDGALEEYRSLRTNILLSAPAEKLKTILMTSALPSEGKTTVSTNVAIVLAQSGLKVLLIDGDLRRPTGHKLFGMKNDKGFSTVLLGVDTLENSIQKTEIEGLDFLSAGSIVPDPPKLFHNAQMQELLKQAGKYYDRVIIDSAPVLTVTDSVILGDWVDGIVLVIKGARTSRMAVKKAKETLLDNSSKILGTVINNLPENPSIGYYYGYKYNYKYGYKYGYGTKKGSKKRPKKDTEKIIV